MQDTSSSTLPTEQAIAAAARELRADAVTLLQEMVRHPSLLGEEQSAQDFMAATFAGLGLRVDQFQIDEQRLRQHPAYSPSIVSYEGRTNVVGIHHPSTPYKGHSLIFNGHIDVVPVGAEVLWSRPPFGGVVEGDRLYGRGAFDMKAGIVAYSMAYKALRSMGLEPAAPVYFQSVIEEECTGNGALACLVEGYRADAAIITEPVQGVMTCQLGVMWFTIEVFGRPAHASIAQTGASAVDVALDLVKALKRIESSWNEPSARYRNYAHHPHPINFNLGKIEGGEWTSSVPTRCRAEMRISFYPDRKPAEVRALVEATLATAFAAHPASADLRYEVHYSGFQADGCDVPLDSPIVRELQRCYQDVIGKPLDPSASTGTTDIKYFNLYGDTPAICYGPSGGANYHGIDEWVSIDSMMECTAVLAVFMARWCGLNRIG